MGNKPWRDWVPGVLTRRQVGALVKTGAITEVEAYPEHDSDQVPPSQYDHSSLDLHIAEEGFELIEGAVKPSGSKYFFNLRKDRLISPLQPCSKGVFQLKAKKTYLFKLKERLDIGDMRTAEIYGQATAPSTIGRMDVLARLVVDGMSEYDYFDPEDLDGSMGELFVEVTPMTFNVMVRPNDRLTQLRFFYGPPEASIISGKKVCKAVLLRDEKQIDHILRVDLTPTPIANRTASAFYVNYQERPDTYLPLWEPSAEEKPKPWQYWWLDKADERNRLQIKAGRFYILRSKERIALTKNVAVYARAIDESIGEMRIHYAGFVHPFFGRENKEPGKIGTPLIFEVRGHDVDVSLRDGEKMAKLIFYRMSEDCGEEKKSGASGEHSVYNDPYANQELQLSKIFAPWPGELEEIPDQPGRVRPKRKEAGK